MHLSLRSVAYAAVLALLACAQPPAPAVPPGPPLLVSFGAFVGGANLSWAPPSESGSHPLTGYRFQVDPAPAGLTAAISGTTATLGGLEHGTRYSLTVIATSAAGVSEPSNAMTVTTPRAPDAPTAPQATGGVREVTLTWTAPENDGGDALLGYAVTVSTGGLASEPIDLEPTETSLTLPGLQNGTRYAFTILARNRVGDSAPTPSVETTTFDVPAAPTGVTATADHGRATIQWLGVTVDGGSPVLSYVVRATPGGLSMSAPATGTQVILTGLKAATSYTFTVEARNAVGTGLASAPSSSTTTPDRVACTGTVVLPNRPAVTTTTNIASPVVADFDGDGKPDLAFALKTKLVGVALGDGAGGFAPNVTTTLIDEPLLLVAGHFDADTMLDLLAFTAGSKLRVLAGKGDGTFTPGAEYTLSGATQMLAADFNADGKTDVAIAIRHSDRIVFRYGNGDGTLATAINVTVGQQPVSLAAGHLDGDARLDLVVAEALVDTLSVLRLDDAGTWVRTRPLVSAVRSDIALADFNGDSKLDLLGVEWITGRMSLSLGQGDGTFGGSTVYKISDGSIGQVAALDANRDGKLDAVILDTSMRVVITVLGNGLGDFSTLFDSHAGVGSVSSTLGVADFDGDGLSELVTVSVDERSVVTLESDGSGRFGADAAVAIGLGPSRLLTADFNGDGYMDVVATASKSKRVVTFLGRAADSLRAPVSTAVAEEIHVATVGDFNADGRPDLAVASFDKLQLLLGRGDGRFDVRPAVPLAFGAAALFSGDFDRDGHLDLAVVERGDWNLRVHRGDGEGAFVASTRTALTEYVRTAGIGDFNKDGRADIVVLYESADRYHVHYGNSGGGFSNGPSFNIGDMPRAVAAGDLDGDGDDDLVVGFGGEPALKLHRSNGNNTFAPAVDLPVSAAPSSLSILDLDGDGKAEIVAAQNGMFEVFEQDGAGGFSDRRRYASLRGGKAHAAADVNGDGRVDLLFATDYADGTSYDELIALMLNRCEP